MLNTRICKQCAKPIEGDYVTALGADWHPQHFCCALCQRPIAEAHFTLHDGQPCHPACYENQLVPRCTLCHKALTGQHQMNIWGDRFCLGHEQELASCSYCGRLVAHATKRLRRRSIEDIRCDVCAATAIETTAQAQQLMPNLIAWAQEQGVKLRQKTFRLEVLDRAEFNARDGGRDGGRRDPLGLTTSTRYMRNKRVASAAIESVAILRGLPLTLFEGVCVHELGHVWLVQHSIVNLPPLDEEGFCEWLSHRHYLEIDSQAAQFYAERIAKNSNPIYGDGFRKLQRLEERLGFAPIIKSLLRKKKLPL